MAEPKRIYAFMKSFPRGIDSDVDPLLLPKDQMAFAINATVRGDFVKQRSNYRTMFATDKTTGDFQTGLFQGACYYRTASDGFIMAAVGGNLFQIGISGDACAINTVQMVSGSAPSDPTPQVPSVPVGVAGSPTNTSVVLTWQPSSGATSYNVYRGGVAVALGVQATTYTDTGLTPSTSYSYQIQSSGSGGVSALSSAISVTTQTVITIPSAPTGLTATVGNALINLAWNVTAGALSLKVYRGTTSGGETLLDSAITGLTYSDTTVAGNQAYYYRVSAVNSAGESALSSEVSNTYIPPSVTTAPGQVTGLTATAASDTAINLSWTAPASGTQPFTYKIYQGTTGIPVLTSSGVTGTTYRITGLSPATAYIFKVAATNSAGDGALSDQVSATTNSSVGAVAPSAPQGLTVTPASTVSVRLNWAAPATGTNTVGDPIVYDIYKGTASGGETSMSSGITGLTILSGALTNGTTYFYYVKARNSAGTSPASNEASGSPIVNTTPTLTSAFYEGVSNGSSLVALVWPNVAGATSYKLYFKLNSDASFAFNRAGVVSGTPYSFLSTDYSGYSFYITAVVGLTESSPSNIVTVSDLPVITSGTVLQGSGCNSPNKGSMSLVFANVTGATSYNAYVTLGGGPPTKQTTGYVSGNEAGSGYCANSGSISGYVTAIIGGVESLQSNTFSINF